MKSGLLFVGVLGVIAAVIFAVLPPSQTEDAPRVAEEQGQEEQDPESLPNDLGVLRQGDASSDAELLTPGAVSRAIDTSNVDFFEQLRANPHCAECEQIFAELRAEFVAATDPNKLRVLAEAFAASGRPELVQDLIARFRASEPDSVERSVLIDALADVTGGEDVSRVLASLVAGSDEEEGLRMAAVGGLSGLSDPVAAQALIGYARFSGDGQGGYDVALGLGEFIPSADSIPGLERIASDGSLEAPLAIKALFNGGEESTKRALEVVLNASSETEQARLLEGALNHVLLEPQTLNYLRELKNRSTRLSPTVRAFIDSALALDQREADSQAPVL